MPVDDKCSVSVKVKSDNTSEVEAKVNVADGMDLTILAKNPDLACTDKLALSGKFDYKTPAYSVESQFNMFDGAKKVGRGAAAGITMDCPGLDGVVLGLVPTFSEAGAHGCPIALGYA